jgi:hypothetical protein
MEGSAGALLYLLHGERARERASERASARERESERAREGSLVLEELFAFESVLARPIRALTTRRSSSRGEQR